jgi:hypothetical protein
LNSKTIVLGLGALLIIIALILGGLQLSNAYDFTPSMGGRHLYVYGLFGVIGLIGIIIAAWALMKKETPKATTATTTK